MAFGSCNPSGRWDEVLVRESEDVITDLLEFSFHFCDVLPRVRRLLLLLCAICSSLSATSAADRALPSLPSTWLLQRSVTVCCPSCCFCVISSAAFCFSPSISDSISTWCFVAFSATFNSCCCNVLMTFGLLVSRHRSNFFLRNIVLLVRFSLPLALLILFF